MAIAVRSVKAGMTRFGYLRSRLKDGAKLGCRGAAIGPPTRTPAQCICRFRSSRRTKPYSVPTYPPLKYNSTAHPPASRLKTSPRTA
ncbi:hypothetical protein EYY89_21360 [Hafnia paralvei]|uniref:Uncharacterized protein n=1 Tax=Hafnia paralvei TaxID=546367 RepID=A0A4Q9EC35_9GAMM|nr:hypothetical protein EYY89_21360 [Hafnia paralvei]